MTGLREAGLSVGGSVLNSLAEASRGAPRLPESVLEDCTAVDQQAMGQLQSRDAALYACVTAIKVAHPPHLSSRMMLGARVQQGVEVGMAALARKTYQISCM